MMDDHDWTEFQASMHKHLLAYLKNETATADDLENVARTMLHMAQTEKIRFELSKMRPGRASTMKTKA